MGTSDRASNFSSSSLRAWRRAAKGGSEISRPPTQIRKVRLPIS